MLMPPHMPQTKPGRPSKYSLRAGLAIARLIAEGWTEREIAQLPTDHSTISRWALRHPEFRAALRAAIEYSLGSKLAHAAARWRRRGEPIPQHVHDWIRYLHAHQVAIEAALALPSFAPRGAGDEEVEPERAQCHALARLVHAGYAEPAAPEDRAWVEQVMRTNPQLRTPDSILRAAVLLGLPPKDGE